MRHGLRRQLRMRHWLLAIALTIGFLALLPGLCVGRAPHKERSIQPPAQLTIATWNVLHCAAGVEAITDEAATWDADLIAMQEVPDRDAENIAKRLGMHFHYEPRWRIEGGSVGVLLLSKTPLKHVTPVRDDGGGSFGVMAETNGIRFVAVHLQPMWPVTPTGLQESAIVRDQEATILAGIADGSTFVAGDFNSLPDSEPHQRMAAAYNIDGVVGLTFKRKLLRSRIDYIWLPRRWHGTDGQIADVELSDHRPLILTVEPKP